MRATAILIIEYEVESLTPSDPSVAAMDDATNTILGEICHRVLAQGVKAGRVRAFTVPSLLPPEAPGE